MPSFCGMKDGEGIERSRIHEKKDWHWGIFEIGWLHQPKNSNLTLNLGVTAACGNQRGIAGNLGLMWKF